MDFALGQPSGGATRPCGDKLFASKLAEDSLLTMDRAHTLFTIVTAVSVQLYSLLDSSGRLQESSRKHALLQAAYVPRRKTVITHYFNPLCFWTLYLCRGRDARCFSSQAYHFLPRNKQRDEIIFFALFLMVYSGFRSILILLWHSSDGPFPCAPSGTVAENVVKAA